MTIAGIIQRIEFTPNVYFQQSKLKYWVSLATRKTVVVEDYGTVDELAQKYHLTPAQVVPRFDAIVNRKCAVKINRSFNSFSKFI